MSIHDNRNRQPAGQHDDESSWAVPATLIAAVLIIGGLFYMNSGDGRTKTAGADRSVLTETGPVGGKATNPPAVPTPPRQQ